jgi:precorrin-2 dehydrogenase / sirohydrochlorin ferrochelatase
MDVFPAIFPLKALRVVVAGVGEAAQAKARLFEGSPAELVRVPDIAASDAASYAGARLAFIACSEAEAAAQAARTAGALVNVVDRPELCDFTTPAIVDRGSVVGAVATGGAAPVLAAELRRELEALWPPTLGAVADLLAALRVQVRAARPEPADRRAWLRELIDSDAATLALAGKADAALDAARARLSEPRPEGRLERLPRTTPDLLSLGALQALSRADRIVTATGLDDPVLRLARRDAPVGMVEDLKPGAVDGWLQAGERVVCIGPAERFSAFPGMPVLPVAVQS